MNHPGGLGGRHRLDRLVAAADGLRDAGSFAEAAKAYEAVLAAAPQRHDIRVQFGNMLKDTGRHIEAEAAYRRALTAQPDNPDIFLQLGHTLKLQGRHADARACYLEATRCPAGSPDAQRELLAMGESGALATWLRSDPAPSTVELAARLGAEITALREQVERLSGELAASRFLNAYPHDCWRGLRATLAIPRPRAAAGSLPVTYLLDAQASSPFVAHLQVAALAAQSNADWHAVFVGATGDVRETIARLALGDPRISLDDAAGSPLAAAAGPILAARTGAILDQHMTAWLAYAAAIWPQAGWTLDFEIARYRERKLVPVDVVLRGVTDAETLAEADCAGPLLLLPRDAFDAVAGAAALPVSELIGRAAALLARERRLGHLPLPLAAFPEPAVELPLPAAPVIVPSRSQERIAVLIPTRDHGRDVEQIVASLQMRATQPDLIDITVIDNGSTDPQTEDILATLRSSGRAKVLRADGPFNWSHLNNRAAQASDAAILVFANDDMAMRSHGWDAVIRTHVADPGIGALGARLLYPDGTVQHAGVLTGWPSGTIHDGLQARGEDAGPGGRWRRTRRTAAVTGAFLATRRVLFESLSGFDAVRFPVSYGDIDFCMRLRERDLAILWTPWIELTHHESRSRGADHADEARSQRSKAERLLFEERWGEVAADPSVNPFWLAEGRPFRLLHRPSQSNIEDFVAQAGGRSRWSVRRSAAG